MQILRRHAERVRIPMISTIGEPHGQSRVFGRLSYDATLDIPFPLQE